MSAGERLVTVLLTVAVPETADPEDAAGLIADAAASSALEVVHAVGVEGHLPLVGSTVLPLEWGAPAVVVAAGDRTVLLRGLDGQVRQVPLPAVGPDPWDPASTGTGLLPQHTW